MTLDQVPGGTRVLIDSNIFIYHFAGQSEDCSSFLVRVERREVHGFTGPVVLLEVAHRLMLIEAAEHGGLGPNPAARLSRQPDAVRRPFAKSSPLHSRLAALPPARLMLVAPLGLT